MDLLIVEPLDPEVRDWLSVRHGVRYAPELAQDARALRQALFQVRALIIPPSVAVDVQTLRAAPLLRAVGRLSSGAENIDPEACERAGIEIVRPTTASAAAEAEFAIGALLQMFRRVPVVNAEGLLVGRELGGATVGIVGLMHTAKPLAELLGAFGARVVGYDPAVHATDELWGHYGVRPVSVRELMSTCDAVCVLLSYFTRYRGLVGERLLAESKPNQVLLSLTHSSVFDEHALSEALLDGRIAAAWFDGMEPGMLDTGRPLARIDTLQVTPRVAGTTLESRVRSAWAVARRIDEILSTLPGRDRVTASGPGALVGLEDGPAPA